jgi:hypothetical protein
MSKKKKLSGLLFLDIQINFYFIIFESHEYSRFFYGVGCIYQCAGMRKYKLLYFLEDRLNGK